MRRVWLAPPPLLLGGCVLPPAVQVASLMAEGFSYATTGKGVADHGISMVADKDCAVLRAVKGQEICREDEGDATATAFAPTEVEEDLAGDAAADADALAADGWPPYEPDKATSMTGAGPGDGTPPAAAHLAFGYERPMCHPSMKVST